MKYAPLQTYNGPDIDLAGNVYKGSLARNQIDEAKQNREDREAKKEILGQYSQGDMSLEDASKAMLPYSQDPAGELQKRYQYMQEAPTRELQKKVFEGELAGQSIQHRSQQMELRKKQLQGEVELSSSILSGMEAQVEGLSKDQLDSVLPQLIDKGIEKYKKEAQILGIDEGAIQKSAEEIKAHLDSGTVEERVEKLKKLSTIAYNQVIQGKMLDREELTDEEINFMRSQLDPEFAASLGAGGPFEGTSMEAQYQNVLLSGDPSTDEYKAAYAKMAEPKIMRDDLGNVIEIKPDMSPYKEPSSIGEEKRLVSEEGSSVSMPKEVRDTLSADYLPPAIKKHYMQKEVDKKFQEEMKNYSGEQLKAAGFAYRMEESENRISKLSEGSEGTGLIAQAANAIAAIPSMGLGDSLAGGIRRYGYSPEQEQYFYNAMDWTMAKLRKESGAAIKPEEIQEEYKTYFPMPGDADETKKYKKTLRKTALQSVKAGSGPAFDVLFSKKVSRKTNYKTPEEVRAAYKSGQIDKDEAKDIIKGLKK